MQVGGDELTDNDSTFRPTDPVEYGGSLGGQYVAASSTLPIDCLLLIRVGDFYEAWGDQARALAGLLAITLTGRDFEGGRVLMSGVPYHSIERHLATLDEKGASWALLDHITDPKMPNVRRAITRRSKSLLPGAPTPLDSPSTAPTLDNIARTTSRQSDGSYLLCAMSGGDLYGEATIAPSCDPAAMSRIGAVPSEMLLEISFIPDTVTLTLGPNEILVIHYSNGIVSSKVRNVLTNSNREIDASMGLDILERLVIMADLGSRPIPGGDLYDSSLMWLLISGGAWAWNPECDVPASIKEVCS